MKVLVDIICVLFFLWQLFFGDDWLAFLIRFGVFVAVVIWLVKECTKYKNKQAEAKRLNERQEQVARDNAAGVANRAAAVGVTGAALGSMAGAVAGNEKYAVQGNDDNTVDGGVNAAVQEDGTLEDDAVEMMDGPYGRAPYGGVIWDDEYSIYELIFKNGVYYYNEHSEEWEEDDEDA